MGVNPALQAIRRPQIIDAALAAMAEHGTWKVTLDLVAKQAGMSKGGLVHYFPTKHDLIKTAVVTFFDRIFQRARLTRDEYSDPLDQVLSFTWIYDPQDQDLEVGYRLLFDVMALASQKEEYRAVFHNWVENWISLLTETIEQGNQQGVFHISDPDAIARTISAIYQGIAVRWYLDRDTHANDWAVQSLKQTVTLLLGC